MNRWDIINKIVEKRNYTDYLEIGIKLGNCFREVVCENMIGIEPYPRWKDDRLVYLTSDEYFKSTTKTFDVILVDGLHYHEQVLVDINNSLKHLNKGGVIVLHDCNPIDKAHQVVPISRAKGTWNGDCWKAFVLSRQEHLYHMFTLNTDHGVGIIDTKNESRIDHPIPSECLSYENLDKNRDEWLNLKDTSYLEEWLKGV